MIKMIKGHQKRFHVIHEAIYISWKATDKGWYKLPKATYSIFKISAAWREDSLKVNDFLKSHQSKIHLIPLRKSSVVSDGSKMVNEFSSRATTGYVFIWKIQRIIAVSCHCFRNCECALLTNIGSHHHVLIP